MNNDKRTLLVEVETNDCDNFEAVKRLNQMLSAGFKFTDCTDRYISIQQVEKVRVYLRQEAYKLERISLPTTAETVHRAADMLHALLSDTPAAPEPQETADKPGIMGIGTEAEELAYTWDQTGTPLEEIARGWMAMRSRLDQLSDSTNDNGTQDVGNIDEVDKAHPADKPGIMGNGYRYRS